MRRELLYAHHVALMPLNRDCGVNATKIFMPMKTCGNDEIAGNHADLQVVLLDDHVGKNSS